MRHLATFTCVLTRFLGEFNSLVRRCCPNRRIGDQGATCRPRRRQPWVPGPRAQGPGFFLNPPRNHRIRAGSTSPGGWGAAAETPPRSQLQTPDRIALPVSLGSRQERRGTWKHGLATREPAARHKAAAAQVSAAEPCEPGNVQGLSPPTPASHGCLLRAPAAGFRHLH